MRQVSYAARNVDNKIGKVLSLTSSFVSNSPAFNCTRAVIPLYTSVLQCTLPAEVVPQPVRHPAAAAHKCGPADDEASLFASGGLSDGLQGQLALAPPVEVVDVVKATRRRRDVQAQCVVGKRTVLSSSPVGRIIQRIRCGIIQ